MESLYGFFALLSLLLFASTINARTAPEEYWEQVMKDQPMPDALKGLVNSNPSKGIIKTDCHTSLNTKDNTHLANDVFTDPNLPAFYRHNDAAKNEKKDFVKDFEPRPNVSVYHDEEEKSFVKEFEPRPNVSVYHDEKEKSFVKEFEPRPNVSVYHDGEVKDQPKAFADDFKPSPNVSNYGDH